jgi:WD40 repeat protein
MIWDIKTRKKFWEFKIEEEDVKSLSLHKNYLAITFENKTCIYSVRKKSKIANILHRYPASAVVICENGQYLIIKEGRYIVIFKRKSF